MTRLERGDRMPSIRTEIPGPEARRLSERIRSAEAPGINTLYGDRPNIFMAEALGSNVLDVDGNRYIDLASGFGVASVGHRHPKVVAAIKDQTDLLIHALGDAVGSSVRIELAERLTRLSPIPDSRVYFAVSGSDAVEVSIKTALLFHRGERRRILAFHPAYHGLTLGALNVSSRDAFRDPFSAHLHPELDRLPYACDPDQIEDLLRSGRHAALIVEPIVGREGVLIPPSGWLRELGDIARRYGTLVIVDEIFTGFGRTGRLFDVEHDGLVPDLLCCGKALAGGMPLAAVLGASELMSVWKTSGEALHTATFVAHPPACAAASAVLDVTTELDLPARAASFGDRIRDRTSPWSERFSALRAIRGRGLLWGLELEDSAARRWVPESWSRGILMLAGGPEGRVAQIVPPLTISRDQLDFALDTLEDILQHVSSD